jgi:uncharacterized protein YbjQ (UPF0145 family)
MTILQPPPPDLKRLMHSAALELAGHAPPGHQTSRPATTTNATSDLTIDETLLLHSIGWEAVELVFGYSMQTVPQGLWQWGMGELTAASQAHTNALAHAVDGLRHECAQAGGVGVVGVHIEFKVHPTHISADLVGTAVRPVDAKPHGVAFVSDLSARDFTLLHTAGWEPVGLAFGTSYVYAPRRTMGAALSQKTQNVELTNFTQAMYAARESAMERMQQSALILGGKGVVDVEVYEGPMSFASHVVRFSSWGTAIRLAGQAHRYTQPQVVLPLDDRTVTFQAVALRRE